MSGHHMSQLLLHWSATIITSLYSSVTVVWYNSGFLSHHGGLLFHYTVFMTNWRQTPVPTQQNYSTSSLQSSNLQYSLQHRVYSWSHHQHNGLAPSAQYTIWVISVSLPFLTHLLIVNSQSSFLSSQWPIQAQTYFSSSCWEYLAHPWQVEDYSPTLSSVSG